MKNRISSILHAFPSLRGLISSHECIHWNMLDWLTQQSGTKVYVCTAPNTSIALDALNNNLINLELTASYSGPTEDRQQTSIYQYHDL